ncbi:MULTISPECIES: RrF2 family transcriptional regulator [Marivita]|uniref:Rrf2 family transcriptional regulator n=1 Tax=Marivita cryptomonadis TaxID=505252 RepID=A0A9Q2NTL7_9RHOB|nr:MULTISPECIES: Rrf2 family transcriptional regulator [Marivita]MBM2319724.1 Rrf2 family transcriptional regulator [Marivita cryptomonadis]MBM2329303.1 Rrf2 family transcriptional regulator [Marivita cryptomonadis]MBM2338891.1 Rrf2 family transcriptional regulator [Marivita cryptomonadis]MBM2343549.1 Rrf2 family transcriptional regulator [Marivita cryptomonadis]MBM2348226.1 Rrf2 family transcriptional regulator [Marivita cryptomonadis]
MRLTTRTNLAARTLMFCAVNEDQIVRTSDIAERCNASINHVARVVQRLQSEGYLETLRGRTGGIRLAKPSNRISIGAVFRIFETEIPFAECFDEIRNTCPLASTCRLRSYVVRALEAFYHELDMVTLEDLVRGNCGLMDLLALRPDLSGSCSGRTASA